MIYVQGQKTDVTHRAFVPRHVFIQEGDRISYKPTCEQKFDIYILLSGATSNDVPCFEINAERMGASSAGIIIMTCVNLRILMGLLSAAKNTLQLKSISIDRYALTSFELMHVFMCMIENPYIENIDISISYFNDSVFSSMVLLAQHNWNFMIHIDACITDKQMTLFVREVVCTSEIHLRNGKGRSNENVKGMFYEMHHNIGRWCRLFKEDVCKDDRYEESWKKITDLLDFPTRALLSRDVHALMEMYDAGMNMDKVIRAVECGTWADSSLYFRNRILKAMGRKEIEDWDAFECM